jgi:hypothetical protein
MSLSGINFVRQKSFNLVVRGRQALNRNRTSYPLISGDSFANACEATIYGKKEISKEGLEKARSIFCHSDRLEEFVSTYEEIITAEVLVFGNSDRDFYELNCKFPPSVKAVYLQNSHISDHFFHTLPIGIENLRYGRNGQVSLFDDDYIKQEKIGRILVGPFSPTHPERLELNSWSVLRHPGLQVVSNHLQPKALAALASTFQFIACPRGNGTDTHRFWETLYRGSVPVVKRSAWSQSISKLGIPFIQLESWDFEEFLAESEALVSALIHPSDIPALRMEHWEKVFGLDFY